MIDVKISGEALDLNSAYKKMIDPTCGGLGIFVGTVRNNSKNKEVIRLEFEVYEKMAISEMRKIAQTAKDKWSLKNILIHHRKDIVKVGEPAVIIIAVSPHRDECFQACRYAIDTLKATVPIWKKEVFVDGSEWVTPHP